MPLNFGQFGLCLVELFKKSLSRLAFCFPSNIELLLHAFSLGQQAHNLTFSLRAESLTQRSVLPSVGSHTWAVWVGLR